MNISFSEDYWIQWIDRLSLENYVVLDDLISDELYQPVRQKFFAELASDGFSTAGIGTDSQFRLDREIRGDEVYWLTPEKEPSLKPFFDLIDEVIRMLNRYCYLSLSGYEFHFAHYPAGTFYMRHLDQFQRRNNRLISIILYLNDAWQQGDGGELKLFLDDREEVIEPLAKRMVLMRSNLVEHEVMLTHKSRYSLTGWLTYQSAGLPFLQ